MRKIVVVTTYPFEDTNAAKARVEAYLRVLGETSIVVLLCRRSANGAAKPENVVELSTPGIPGRNFIVRGIAELVFSVRLVWRLWRIRPDGAIVTIPSMFLLLAGLTRKFPIVFDVRDLVWNYLPDRGIVNRIAKAALAKFAYALLNKAATVLVTNEVEEGEVRKNVSRGLNIRVVSNGISMYRFDTITAWQSRSSGNCANRSKNVLYVGNVGLAQDLSTLVKVASSETETSFTIVGEGSDRQRIAHLVESLGLINVRLVGGTQWDSLLGHYRRADVLYAQVVDGFDSAIPSKLYEYLAVGIPIIYAGSGASRQFVSRFSGVTCIPPHDEVELKGALDRVMGMKKTINVERNRAIIRENYVREQQARIVNEVFDNLTGDPAAT